MPRGKKFVAPRWKLTEKERKDLMRRRTKTPWWNMVNAKHQLKNKRFWDKIKRQRR